MQFLALTWFLVLPVLGSPVEKVVELIEELKAKIESDGANEQKIYDKFACWCETTTQRKADSIDRGKSNIGTTTDKILMLKAKITGLTNEITELEAKIAANEKSMSELTEIREKENADWQAEKNEMEIAINSLNKAINVLSGAGTGGDMGLLEVAVGVRNAVLNARKLNALSDEDAHLVHSFLENPTVDYYDQKAQAKQSYSPQSATIQGILKDMYSTFATNLQDSNQDESDKQKAFDDEIAELEKDNALYRTSADKKEERKADNESRLAANEQKLSDLEGQLKEDEEFFDTTRTSCKRKSDEWDERCRMRTEEIDGIEKALGILTSDKARAIFANATGTRPIDTFGSAGVDGAFLQVAQRSNTLSPMEVAYRQLKTVSSKTKSLRLASIAATVRSTSEGHFNQVIDAIDTMVNTLKTEEAADIEQRDWCIEDRHNNNNEKDRLDHVIKVLNSDIDKLENDKDQMEADIKENTQLKTDLENAMADALDDRNAENAAFITAKSDDEAAIALLEDAIAALSEYGNNNLAMLQQPVFAVSEDQAPDATFSTGSKYSGASNGIVGLLEQIKRELENEVTTGTNAEKMAQDDYRTLFLQSTAQRKSYNDTINALNVDVDDTEGKILDKKGDKRDAESDRQSVVNYLQRIKPNCDWIMSAFEKRYEARKMELNGLGTAKATLSGSQGGEFGFLQKQ